MALAHHGGEVGEPRDGLSAQHNVGFSIALKAVEGENHIQSYLDSRKWSDPQLRRISDSVQVLPLDLAPGESPLSARVDVHLRDRSTLSRQKATFRGHTFDPADWGEIERRFRTVTDGLVTVEEADAAVAGIADLEAMSSVTPLLDLIQRFQAVSRAGQESLVTFAGK